jgi:hypothetical protein
MNRRGEERRREKKKEGRGGGGGEERTRREEEKEKDEEKTSRPPPRNPPNRIQASRLIKKSGICPQTIQNCGCGYRLNEVNSKSTLLHVSFYEYQLWCCSCPQFISRMIILSTCIKSAM